MWVNTGVEEHDLCVTCKQDSMWSPDSLSSFIHFIHLFSVWFSHQEFNIHGKILNVFSGQLCFICCNSIGAILKFIHCFLILFLPFFFAAVWGMWGHVIQCFCLLVSEWGGIVDLCFIQYDAALCLNQIELNWTENLKLANFRSGVLEILGAEITVLDIADWSCGNTESLHIFGSSTVTFFFSPWCWDSAARRPENGYDERYTHR